MKTHKIITDNGLIIDMEALEAELKAIQDAVIADPAIVDKLHDWLGVTGRLTFRGWQKTYGTVIPVIPRATYPHCVHFNEGMDIRNFLRGLPECKFWTHDQFENEYPIYIKLAMQECVEKFPLDRDCIRKLMDYVKKAISCTSKK
jgi:hypothetical protein